MSVSVPGPFFSLSDVGLPTVASQLLEQYLSVMQTVWPGYSPEGGATPEWVQAQIFAAWAANCAQLCTLGGSALFRQFGTQLLALPYEPGSAAAAVAQITATDTSGYVLPAGTQITLTLGAVQVGFQTVSSLQIPAGSLTGTVPVAAVLPGSAFNGATNPAATVAQIDWVASVSVLTPSSGGVDQETDDDYQARLAAMLQLLAPRPITAADYATMALSFIPAPGSTEQEVGRATAIDGYDPPSGTYGNEREVTVCVTDPNGIALNAATMSAVAQWLTSLREANFLVNVVAPNYTTVYVACTVVATAGYPATVVQANVQAALLNFLTPANFGTPSQMVSGWENTTNVYLSVVESVVQGAAGVDHIPAGTLAVDVRSPPTNTTADLALTGAFPLVISSAASIPTSAITVIT
jgi:hypothetical protein